MEKWKRVVVLMLAIVTTVMILPAVSAQSGFENSTVYVYGNGSLSDRWCHGIGWMADQRNAMINVSENVWEITFNEVPKNNGYQFKFVLDENWSTSFGNNEGTFVSGEKMAAGGSGSANISFDIPYATADVKICLDLTEYDPESGTGGIFTVTIKEPKIEVNLETVEGAQIRIRAPQGLRFISQIDKTTGDFSRVKEYGTILIPSENLTDVSQLVIDAELEGRKVAKVPAVKLYKEDETSVTFTAVITDIAEKNYTRSYTARAYAILEDGTVVYGDSATSRSIYNVAENGLRDVNASAEEKEIFQQIVEAAKADNDFEDIWE